MKAEPISLSPRGFSLPPEQIKKSRHHIGNAAPAPGIYRNSRGHAGAQGGLARMGFKADAHRQALPFIDMILDGL